MTSRPSDVRPLLEFLGLTYAATWICWAAAVAVMRAGDAGFTAVSPAAGTLFLLGTIAPSLVALALTASGEGANAAGVLFSRIFKWQVNARWYVFAVGYIATIKLTAALVCRVATGAWPRFGGEHWYVILAALTISTWTQAGEEIGWRGYALPRERGTAADATSLVAWIATALLWLAAAYFLVRMRGIRTLQLSA